MKRIEREKVIRNAYRTTVLVLTACCIFLGVLLVVHEMAREAEVSALERDLEAKGVVRNDEGLYSSVELFLPEKIYVATGDELKAFWKGFEICGLIVHDELEAEPKWCLKCFFFMKKITDAPAGRISVDLTGIEQKIRGFKANIKEM